VSEHGHYESYRSRVRRDIESLMEGGPDETRFTSDDGGVWRRLDEHDHTIDELADYDVAEGELGYSVRNLPAGHGVPDDNDGPGSDLLSDTNDDTDNETEETTMIEKTDAERAEAARQGTMRSEPDTAIAQAVKAYMAANGGTFGDALAAVQQADGAMWRAYARWLVHKKATNNKTRDDLADLALEYKYAAGQHLLAMAEAEAALDNSAALAKATTIFTSEHGGGLAGIDAARTYLRVKRPDLFEAEPDERS
jgi:hypothetical protein